MRIPRASEKTEVEPIDAAVLEPLATTRELRQVLDELKSSDVPEVRDAWLEKFAATAACPECGGPLRHRRGTFISKCGWRTRP